MIKKFFILLLASIFSYNLAFAEDMQECLFYENYCIKDLVPTYKLLGEPTKINDKVISPKPFTGSFAVYAENYCSSIGYRIPRVDEAQKILNYLLWVPYDTNHLIWLKGEKMVGTAQALDYNKFANDFRVREVRTSTQGVETMCIKDISN